MSGKLNQRLVDENEGENPPAGWLIRWKRRTKAILLNRSEVSLRNGLTPKDSGQAVKVSRLV